MGNSHTTSPSTASIKHKDKSHVKKQKGRIRKEKSSLQIHEAFFAAVEAKKVQQRVYNGDARTQQTVLCSNLFPKLLSLSTTSLAPFSSFHLNSEVLRTLAITVQLNTIESNDSPSFVDLRKQHLTSLIQYRNIIDDSTVRKDIGLILGHLLRLSVTSLPLKDISSSCNLHMAYIGMPQDEEDNYALWSIIQPLIQIIKEQQNASPKERSNNDEVIRLLHSEGVADILDLLCLSDFEGFYGNWIQNSICSLCRHKAYNISD
ncbi:hypothetical protein BLNAU_19572 [Blattamonas nauphoetae]|uniref:Uncharacterized protein n=1 Tax=Blattamonas nauphoetae TaxID=2049346 RepID=A0ABQ9X165_9EUKA|nr:hypothetical protein BLNAU_19572 [Blattamonas nauphoetae]